MDRLQRLVRILDILDEGRMSFFHLAYMFLAQARQVGSRLVFVGVKVLRFDIASLFWGRALRFMTFNYRL
jgi:hypothetical protein